MILKSPQARSAITVAGGLAVVLLTFLWLNRLQPHFLATDDGIRDLLLARDCAEQGYCHTRGSPSSLPGFYQGAVWTHLLALVHVAGGRSEAQRILVHALAAVAAGTFFVVICRWLRPTLAVPATALFVATLGKDHLPVQLASGGAWALPSVVFCSALLALGLTGRWRFLLIAAFGLAVAINEHIVSLIMLAPLGIVLMLACERPWRAALVAATVLVAVCAATSGAALRANLLACAGHPRMAWLLSSAIIAALVCHRLGPRFRRLGTTGRAFVVGALALLPMGLGAVYLLVERHHFSLHYVNPVLAPAAILAVALLCVPFELAARRSKALGWLPTVATLIGVGAIATDGATMARLAAAHPAGAWSVAEAEALATAVAERGRDFDGLVFRLQSVGCRELVTRMSLFAPPPRRRDAAPVLQVRRRSGVSAGDAVATVGTSSGPIDLFELDSWLLSDEIRACRRPLAAGDRAVCVKAKPWSSRSNPGLVSSRSFPELHLLDLERPYRAIYELPLRPAAGEWRSFQLADDDVGECGWRISSIAGLEADRPLPARRVTVRATGEGGATLILAKPFGITGCRRELDMRYPPCLLESPAGDRGGAS